MPLLIYPRLFNCCCAAAVVTTLAGGGGSNTGGYLNGNGVSAKFLFPYCVSVDTVGNVLVADNGNNLVRRINTAGT